MSSLKSIMEAVCTDDEEDLFETSSSDEEILNGPLFSSSSSSTDDGSFRERRKLHRVQRFVEQTVTIYDNLEFKEHFRMSRRTCSIVIDIVAQAKILPEHTFGREKISAEKAVLMTIWYLSNQETFRQISDRFDVTKSSAHRVITKVVQHLVTISKQFIKWPSYARKVIVRDGFRQMNGIDGVVAAIDGCHINIKRPITDAFVYCNRKSEYSILLQGVCDHEKRFIDYFCGEAGSIHDSRLLKRSDIYEKGINGFFGTDFVLGDSAYPCLNWLIPPFRDNGQLTRNQRLFNYRHSATRVVIENAFGLLKGRFRRLKGFENEDITLIVQCVVAAGVLHNICLDCDDEIAYEPEESDCEDFDEQMIHNICGVQPNDQRRNDILKLMFNSDK